MLRATTSSTTKRLALSNTTKQSTSTFAPGIGARRKAHLSSHQTAVSTSFLPPPIPIPSTSSSTSPSASTSIANEQQPPSWSDPSYLALYRDPRNHDRVLVRPQCTKSKQLLNSSSPLASTSTSPLPSSSSRLKPNTISTMKRPQPTPSRNETPRSRRLEMERLWSGGDFSPPLPDELPRITPLSVQKHAVLFPGSASQYVGMGEFLKSYSGAEKVWKEAEEALEGFEEWVEGLKLEEREGDVGELGKMVVRRREERVKGAKVRETVFGGPQDELTRSEIAQPAILITSIAFLKALEEDFESPIARRASCFLGHSSGEYSAAVASGAISLTDGVRLTRLHGILTSYALDLPSIRLKSELGSPPSVKAQMSALVLNPGHSHSEVTSVVEAVNAARPKNSVGKAGTVEIASYNSKAQVVLAGTREGILRASEELREKGIASRAADLPVSAPFHCSFMKPAAEGMRVALEKTSISNPTAPVVSGLDGSLIKDAPTLISNLVDQISLPVRWSSCVSSLRSAEINVNRLIFLGPGKALANLARRDIKMAEKEGEKRPKAENGEEVEMDVVSVATDEEMGNLRLSDEE